MRPALVLGWVLYALGASGAGWLVWQNAVADPSLVRIEAPSAPALELAAGTYVLRPSAGARVFDLRTRSLLDLRPAEGGASFQVERPGIYIVELLTPGDSTALHRRRMLAVSPTALVVAAAGPLATLPGLALLARAGDTGALRVTLGGSVFNVVSVRRRLAGVALDLLSVGALMILLLLSGPLFPPLTPLIPLAPLVYLWSGNTRGRTLGRWLTGTCVVSEAGRPVGVVDGLIRTLGEVAGWLLLGAGYVFAALHPERRAPHDLLSRSYVIYA